MLDEQMWQAVQARDAAADGLFVISLDESKNPIKKIIRRLHRLQVLLAPEVFLHPVQDDQGAFPVIFI